MEYTKRTKKKKKEEEEEEEKEGNIRKTQKKKITSNPHLLAPVPTRTHSPSIEIDRTF
jgi:hypothetical protein